MKLFALAALVPLASAGGGKFKHGGGPEVIEVVQPVPFVVGGYSSGSYGSAIGHYGTGGFSSGSYGSAIGGFSSGSYGSAIGNYGTGGFSSGAYGSAVGSFATLPLAGGLPLTGGYGGAFAIGGLDSFGPLGGGHGGGHGIGHGIGHGVGHAKKGHFKHAPIVKHAAPVVQQVQVEEYVHNDPLYYETESQHMDHAVTMKVNHHPVIHNHVRNHVTKHDVKVKDVMHHMNQVEDRYFDMAGYQTHVGVQHVDHSKSGQHAHIKHGHYGHAGLGSSTGGYGHAGLGSSTGGFVAPPAVGGLGHGH